MLLSLSSESRQKVFFHSTEFFMDCISITFVFSIERSSNMKLVLLFYKLVSAQGEYGNQNFSKINKVAVLKNRDFEKLGRDLTVWHGDDQLVEVSGEISQKLNQTRT